MNLVEGITTALSTAALLVAGISLYWSRSAMKLAERQLQASLDAERKTHIRVHLGKAGSLSHHYAFYFTNSGSSPATSVSLVGLDDMAESESLVAQCIDPLPIPVIAPGSAVAILTGMTMGTRLPFSARVMWVNADGTAGQSEAYISLLD